MTAVLCLPPMLAPGPAGRSLSRRGPPLSSAAGAGWAGIRGRRAPEEGKKEKRGTRAGPRLQAAGVPGGAWSLTVRRGGRAGSGALSRPGSRGTGLLYREGECRRRWPGGGTEKARWRACALGPRRDGGPDPEARAGCGARRLPELVKPRSSFMLSALPRGPAGRTPLAQACARRRSSTAAETMEGGSAQAADGAPPAPALAFAAARRRAGTRAMNASPAPPGPPGPALPCPMAWPRGERGRAAGAQDQRRRGAASPQAAGHSGESPWAEGRRWSKGGKRKPGKKDSRRLPWPERVTGRSSFPAQICPQHPLVSLLSVLSEVQCPGIPNTRKFSVLGLDSFPGLNRAGGV